MHETSYDAEYLQGIEHFNAHEFFEAHEVWEAVWVRTSGRHQLFYKGLIHAAVALHHYGNRNVHGARKVWASCLKYLSPYSPHHLGLDLESFLQQMADCFAPIANESDCHGAELAEQKIPRIELTAEPLDE